MYCVIRTVFNVGGRVFINGCFYFLDIISFSTSFLRTNTAETTNSIVLMNKRANEEFMIEMLQNDMIGKAYTENEHLGVVQRRPTPREEDGVQSRGRHTWKNYREERSERKSPNIFWKYFSNLICIIDTKLNHFAHSPIIIFTTYQLCF